MDQDPDDTRPLFQRVVDDIRRQIAEGELHPNDALPSLPNLAEAYGVSTVTAQRVLRELKTQRITYSVAGRGTFVHPGALDLLRGDVLREPIDDPDLGQEVAAYLAAQQQIFARYLSAPTIEDKEDALASLIEHAENHQALIDRVLAYQAARGSFAQKNDWRAPRSPQDPPAVTVWALPADPPDEDTGGPDARELRTGPDPTGRGRTPKN